MFILNTSIMIIYAVISNREESDTLKNVCRLKLKVKIIYKQSDDPKAPLRLVSLYLCNLGNKQHLSCFTMLKCYQSYLRLLLNFVHSPTY